MTESDYNCQTCSTVTCEYNPNNTGAYFVDQADDEVKLFPEVKDIHEFTAMKGCAVHSEFMAPLLILEEEIKGGQAKYQEMITTTENGDVYTLAAKALTVCLQRIQKLKCDTR